MFLVSKQRTTSHQLGIGILSDGFQEDAEILREAELILGTRLTCRAAGGLASTHPPKSSCLHMYKPSLNGRFNALGSPHELTVAHEKHRTTWCCEPTWDKQSACCDVKDLKTRDTWHLPLPTPVQFLHFIFPDRVHPASMHHTQPSHMPLAWLEARPVLQAQSFPCINGDDGLPGRHQGHSTLEALNGQHLKRLKDRIPNRSSSKIFWTPLTGENCPFDFDAFPCLSSYIIMTYMIPICQGFLPKGARHYEKSHLKAREMA